MSIVIKGMEMPNDRPQMLWVYPDGTVLAVDPWRKFQVVPVLPNGRLIDADALIERISDLAHKAVVDGFDLGALWYTAFIRHIELAPTIISSEEGVQDE